MQHRRAFTLIELLVVVAIITTLIAILLPALATSKRTAKEAVCGTDIRMLIVTSITYAHGSVGWLPQMQDKAGTSFTQSHAYWSYPYWRKLLRDDYGVQRQHYYSASNDVWRDDDLYYWGWDGSDVETATHMVMGRFYFGTANLVDRDDFKNAVVDPAIPTNGRLFASKTNHKANVDLLWTDLNRSWGGYFINGGNRFGANHMYTQESNTPDGTHLGHVDGSVTWSGRDEIKLRIQYPTPNFADLYW